MKKLLIILIFVLLPLFVHALALPTPEVVINEIAWMGTTTSANDEWMELHNTTNEEIDLNGWLLKTVDEKLKIYLTGKIPANGFYLLERTDDKSVPAIPANQIYTGALNNGGQSLELSQNSQIIIDNLAFTGGWPAGDNATKQTMERTDFGAWQTSKSPNGTPKAQNNPAASETAVPQEKAVVEIKSEPAPVPAQDIKYPEEIMLSEILPAPEGADENNEWIELYNANAFEVNLAGWKLQDTQGTITTYTFGETAKISANGYMTLKRPETKITLNNETDGLNLLWPNDKAADSVAYSAAPANQSYNVTSSGWQWSATLTPGAKNIIEQPPAKTVSLPKPKKSDKNIAVASIKDAVAPLEQHFSEDLKNSTGSPWLLFFVALGIAIISAITILILIYNAHVWP